LDAGYDVVATGVEARRGLTSGAFEAANWLISVL
jgi:hypothetical protein